MELTLNHFDESGNAVMVDVSSKEDTLRIARAGGLIHVGPAVFDIVKNNNASKGDVLGVARVAGIMAAKRTSELIPMCHPLMLTKAAVDFNLKEAESEIEVICTVKLTGKTGVEMEALTGASVALLTIYDMCKGINKSMTIKEVCLIEKTGGKSGYYERGL